MRQTTLIPHIDKNAGPAWNGKIGNWDASSKPKLMIVLHTMVGYLTGTDAEFANPNTKHSAHYGIGLNGEIHQYVSEAGTAYHAGKYDINQIAIGIEHEDSTNSTDAVRTPELYQASARLVADICQSWEIPCDRDSIKKHNEIIPTGCPGGLDVDKIVSMAQALLRQQTEPAPETNMTTDEKNAIEVLKTSGISAGNLEGLVRGLIDTVKRYSDLTSPDSSGKPPVVISADHFVDITIKSQNLDRISDYFGYTEFNEVDPTFGDKIVEQIRVLSPKIEPKDPISTSTDQSSWLGTVIDPSKPSAQPLNSDQATISLTGNSNILVSIFSKIASLYSTLFISKEGAK